MRWCERLPVAERVPSFSASAAGARAASQAGARPNASALSSELTAANAPELLKESALVVDAFDNHSARAAVSQVTRAAHLPCLHIGFSPDGLYGSGVWEPDYQVPRETPGDPCDYPLTRPFALALSSLAARAIADFFRLDLAHEFEITWNDLKIRFA